MRRSNGRGGSVSLLFVILLFFSLALCALFTILIGAKGYENINNRMEGNYESQTILSYISNKVKQTDTIGDVSIEVMEGQQVLVLRQKYGNTDYETFVYYLDGQVMELFTEKNSGMGLSDGIAIIASPPLSFEEVDDNLICVSLDSQKPEQLYLCTRSGGVPNE